VQNDICVVNLDRRTTLSTRIYDRTDGHVGVFVGEGSVTARRFELSAHPS
jgi:beta-fructofuranosidase